MLDRSKAPEFVIPGDLELTPPKVFQLSKDRKLFFFPTPNLEAIKLEVISSSQRHLLPLQKALVPSFTLQLLSEGTNQKSESELSEFFDFHASEVHPLTSFSHEGISLLTTKKHLSEVLTVFLSLLTEAIFPEESLEKRKSQRKLAIRLEKEKSASRASQLFRKAMFGESHPYGQEISANHVDEISQSDLKKYYKESLWTGSEYFLSGDLRDNELEEILSLLESLPSHPKTEEKLDLVTQITPQIFENRDEALQSSIRIGNWSIPKSHPDFMALSVFNTILGGYFGSRLIKNIREDKGHTYGIHSSLAEIGDYAYWVIGADVQKEFRQEVMDEIYKEINLLTSELVSQEEIEVVRNYLIGQMLSRFSSSFDLMDRFRSVHHSGLDLSYFLKKLAFLKTFTPEDIKEVGQKYFGNPPFIEVLVG